MSLESQKTDKRVLVIGGGVAGMAAARTLAGYGLDVHLVEKTSRPGGHAAAGRRAARRIQGGIPNRPTRSVPFAGTVT